MTSVNDLPFRYDLGVTCAPNFHKQRQKEKHGNNYMMADLSRHAQRVCRIHCDDRCIFVCNLVCIPRKYN